MSREINFLEERRKRVNKVNKADQHLFQIALTVFGVVLVVCVLVFAVRFYFGRQAAQLAAEQEATKNQILNNQDAERSFVLFVHKLSILSQIYQNRQQKKEAINYFTKIFGPDVLITQIEFDQQTKLLQFHLKSKDIFTLQKVIEVVNSDQVKQQFTSVNPSDLTRGPDGSYQLSLAVVTPVTPQ